MFQRRLNLFARNAGKPIQEIVYPPAVLKIREQRCHRHTSSLEDPRATDTVFCLFDGSALIPIERGE